MVGDMRLTENALPHTQLSPEPVRRANPIVVVVVGDEISKNGTLSTPDTVNGSSGLNLARLHVQYARRTRGRGIPITIPAHMRHSRWGMEVSR